MRGEKKLWDSDEMDSRENRLRGAELSEHCLSHSIDETWHTPAIAHYSLHQFGSAAESIPLSLFLGSGIDCFGSMLAISIFSCGGKRSQCNRKCNSLSLRLRVKLKSLWHSLSFDFSSIMHIYFFFLHTHITVSTHWLPPPHTPLSSAVWNEATLKYLKTSSLHHHHYPLPAGCLLWQQTSDTHLQRHADPQTLFTCVPHTHVHASL